MDKIVVGGYLISDDISLMQIDRVYEMVSKTYWAQGRSVETVAQSIMNSLCFGIFKDGVQIGFARVLTDYATLYYLLDVVIDENFRGLGLGKELIKYITGHEDLIGLTSWLATSDAHGLYEQFGYVTQHDKGMRRAATVE